MKGKSLVAWSLISVSQSFAEKQQKKPKFVFYEYSVNRMDINETGTVNKALTKK